jgi:hypothetical protein
VLTSITFQLPLFFFSDRPHPSYMPSLHSHPPLADSDSEDEDDIDEGLDPERLETAIQERRARAAQRRALRGGTVFGASLQSPVLLGMIAK